MPTLIQKILNTGIKHNYLPWEINVTKRLNAISILALLILSFSILFFIYFDYFNLFYECLIPLLVSPIILLLNYFKNYLWATYFYFIGYVLFFFLINIKIGIDTLVILYYFPLIILAMFSIGRKENFKHVLIFSGIIIFTIFTIANGINFTYSEINLSQDIIQDLSLFNIFFSFCLTILIIYLVLKNYITQNNNIKIALMEKTLLLAEVNHRVKNNLSVILGLINLKKINVITIEAKLALEETKNRIYSMALLHQYLLDGSDLLNINFQEYIEKIVSEIKKTFPEKLKVKLLFDTEKMEIDISNAVPLGLILNELITNSFEHTKNNEEELEIKIKFKSNKNRIELVVRDNRTGIKIEDLDIENSISLELIKTLSEQIKGEYSLENDSGFVFRLIFS